ncbi:NTE family protein [Povalibacter uvarum]|uniref:NTE family protein n=1 Tax=Povalibacter uvarum TaxID=732238 RepID=A0A841HPD7_9GAMM|nr:patatin-like phospholipase family protein [Povalibacter uvarum]MBB6095181.1 NTE family protein [Povalibacter uvarum]
MKSDDRLRLLHRAVVFVAASVLVSMPALCADTTQASKGRPRVGLVLAGGGAKGGAHVGVLKVMEELHVPVDCIAGTSMGALIGGGYASGIPAAGLEEFVSGIDWKAVVGNQGTRELEPIEQKRAGATYSNDFELGITKEGIVSPGGLVNTSNIDDLLRTYVASARLESSFDELPIPYRAIATDMVQSRMVVLDRGDLATAMRASMAIPGAFAPVQIDQMILSDGGLVRNIPVDVARDLCADVVIVVNLVEPPADPKRLRSATQLLSRTMDVMIEANENLQLASLRPGDVRVDVYMGDITTADFERVPDTIPLGEAAARAMAADLSKYAVPQPQYTAWRQAVTTSQHIEAKLADVRYEGLKFVNPEYLKTTGLVEPGDTINTSVISREAQRMAALQDLDSVGYRLDGDPAQPTLTWLPREKSWGPNYLKADLGVYSSVDGDLTFTIYGRHVRTWLNSLGAEWRNELQVGGETLIATSWFQPLDAAHRFFVEPKVLYSLATEDVFRDDERIARYNFQDFAGILNTGVNLGRYAQARVGYIYDSRDVKVDIGSELMPESSPVDAGFTAALEYDSRDTGFSPQHGMAAALEYIHMEDSLGGDRNWERAEMGLGVALPFRKDIWWVTVAGGSDLKGNLPADRAFALGGPGSFPGLELGELRVGGYWTAGTSYLWNVKDLMSIRNLALYAGVRVAGGAVYDRIDDGRSGDIYGGSIFLTGRTFFGPLTIGVGATTTDSWSAWLSIGRPVGHGTILERGIFR